MFSLPHIFLGSSSPRRKELLEVAGFEITIVPHNIDEVFPNDMDTSEVPLFLCKEKMKSIKKWYGENKDKCYITADSIVVMQDTIYGKPKDKEDALSILNALSGTTHSVITGVCIEWKGRQKVLHESTTIYMKPLNEKMLKYYIEAYAPFDKAGAYGIQEWLGLVGVEKIDGDFFNVTGLPISKVYQAITNW